MARLTTAVSQPREAGSGPFWQDRRVLVTGASGLLGAWLVHELVEAEAEVVALVRDQIGWSHLVRSELTNRCALVSSDIIDLEALTRVVNEYECSTVFHLAAQAVVGVARRDPVSTFEANVRGTWVVLEACRRAGCVEAIVVASSDKAYGELPNLPYHEDDELAGREVYEASKVAAEVVCRPYATTFELPVAITRCANLFGGGDLNWSRLIPGTIRAALRGQRPVIRSDGSPIRDYLYVRDAAHGAIHLAAALLSGRHVGEAFNLSAEDPRTVLDVVDHVLRILGREDLDPVVLGDAPGEIQAQHLSSEKARSLLDWKPRWGFTEGLEETVRWYQEYLSS